MNKRELKKEHNKYIAELDKMNEKELLDYIEKCCREFIALKPQFGRANLCIKVPKTAINKLYTKGQKWINTIISVDNYPVLLLLYDAILDYDYDDSIFFNVKIVQVIDDINDRYR